ncbi:MAG: hypothetical protein AB7K04_05000, partial [Pseudorhodoplanes sp.]
GGDLQDDEGRHAAPVFVRLSALDMDLPSTIYDLPFLDEGQKRAILGGNAQRLFNLDPVMSPLKTAGAAARQPARA